MARSFLARPAIVELLKPFIVTSVHAAREDLSDLEPAAREIYTRSPLSRDPERLNVFTFALDSRGQVVHAFHGVPAGRRAVNPGRSDYELEIRKALALLPPAHAAPTGGVPDLPPAG